MSEPRIEQSYELSPMQQGMLVDALASTESGVDVQHVVCRLNEPLDARSLMAAWARVAQRHPILRTAFRILDSGEPQQDVYADVALPFEQLDWRSAPEPEQRERWASLLEADRRDGFDLFRPPLMRLILVTLGSREHRLLWSFHHSLLDGQSFAPVLAEVFGSLDADREGRNWEPPHSRPYADYIDWVRGQDFTRAEAFWRNALRGFSAPTSLGVRSDTDGGDARDLGAGAQEVRLSAAKTARLEAFARDQGVTLNTLLQGAWALLLHRYSREPEVVFGAVRTLRRSAVEGAENMVGLLVNTLPVRVKVDRGKPLATWLRTLRQAQAEMRSYEHTPLPLVQAWSDVAPGAPLFETVVAFNRSILDTRVRKLEGNWANRRFEYTGQMRFAVSLHAYAEPELPLRLEYYRRILDDEGARRVLGHLQRLLEAMPEKAALSLGDLRLLTETERERLSGWNETEAEAPEKCVHELIADRAGRDPDRVAVESKERALSYRELDERSEALSRRLRARGVGPGMRVGVYLERTPEMVVGVLGVLKAGGAYVPLDPAFPVERLSFLVEDSASAVVLTEKALEGGVPSGGVPIVLVDDVGGDEEPVARPKDALALRREKVTPDDLAYVIYTSGSTGKPKGVAVTHRNLVNFLTSMGREPGLHEDDVLLSVTTLSFDIATLELYLPLMQGARVVVASREEASDGVQIRQRLQASEVTVMQATPATWRLLLESGWKGTTGLRVLCGGEALPRELAKELLSRADELWNVYGPTETTVWSSAWRVEPGDDTVPIGRPIANTQMWVLDESLEPVPVGVPGELYIGGAGVARGYWERPELTAERFVPDPFSAEAGSRLYQTGDLARYLADGRLECLGRLDHQVKVRGFRIELGEIESCLEGHESVRQAVVVARDSASGEARLLGYVVSDGDTRADDLRGHLSQTLPDYMVPSAFVLLDSFPLTPNGKVDRKALPAPEGLMAREQEYVAPRTPAEEILAGIWEEVLRVERVGVGDDFFALGGHSLLAMQVLSRVRMALGVEVPLQELFAGPTVRQLAKVTAGRRKRLDRGLAQPPLEAEPYRGPEKLSFSQQRLWFLDQVDPGRATYVLPEALRLRGALDVGALEKSLGALVGRHESLRTTFAHNGEPLQYVATAEPFSLALVDLIGERERLPTSMTEEVERGFDLVQGPPFRAVLYRLGRQEHVLLLLMHHIVSDEWSLGVLARELGELYRCLTRGDEASLPALSAQYRDFARWQREWLTGDVLAQQLQYWRSQLAGAPQVLELPTDRPRPPAETHRGAKHAFSIPREVSEGLSKLARREGATLFMVLLAAFDVLLSRYTRQKDLLVGTPVANRSRAELEGLVGFFVNTLVLRADLSGDPTVSELLGRVRETCLGAYSRQDLPFERLVEELQPERDLSRNPLFQAMLVLQNVPVEEVVVPELSMTPVRVERETSAFDLTLILEETSEGLEGNFEYATDLFDGATIRRMAGHMNVLLRGLLECPTRHISELPVLTPTERQQLVVSWNQRAREDWPDRCVHELVSSQARRTPDRTAVEFEGRSYSYLELEQKSDRLAARLRARGVGPGARIAVFMDRGLEIVVGLLGALKAGAAYVPVDPELPADRVRYMVEDSGAALLLTTSSAQSQLSECPVPTLDVNLEEPEEARQASGDEARPDDLAYVIYTSGSTGRPKGVGVSHRSVVSLLGAFARETDLTERDVVLQFTTLSFDPSVLDIFSALTLGMRLVLVSREDAWDGSRLAQRADASGATLMCGTPATYRLLLGAGWEGRANLKAVTGGEALTRELADALLSRAGGGVWNAYGPTEATVVASAWRVAGEGSIRVGRPLDNTRLYVLDEHLEPMPVGVPGELYIGGAGVARGYWGRPDLTARSFVPSPFAPDSGARLYRTGDLVRWLPDGDLEYLGRVDHQVKVRGFRIELGEIEVALCEHPSMHEAAVVVREDRPGDRRLVAYLVYEEKATVDTTALRTYLGTRLPAYMIPSAFVSLDQLPLTPSGKVDRKLLPAPDQTRPNLGQSYIAPRSVVEANLATIWSEVLGIRRVGVEDNFFELGGDSILSLQVINRARRAGVPLTARMMFAHPTIAQLAAVAAPAATSDTTEPALAAGAVTLTPIQRWFLEGDPPEPQHWNRGFVLEVCAPLDVLQLERALRELVSRHDALRLRFARGPEGWEQAYRPPSEAQAVRVIDLAVRSDSEIGSAIESEMAALQSSLNLSDGLLLRAAYFDCGPTRPHRLGLIGHNLVMDGMSWRIVLEDLEATYRELIGGQSIVRLPGTKLFGRWAERLRLYARSDTLRSELGYWVQATRGDGPPLPVDNRGHPAEGATGTVISILGRDETRALLEQVPAAYNTEVTDVLVTALAQTLGSWLSSESLLLDLVGRGREALFDDMDLSRAVGWFGHVFPLRLKLKRGAPPGEALTSTKEQLRAVPNRGVGFGLLRYLSGDPAILESFGERARPEVIFDYLGGLDDSSSDNGLFRCMEPSSGPVHSPAGRRGHLLEISAFVVGGQLRTRWTFSQDRHHLETIERLAEGTLTALQDLIAHCQSPGAGGYTPSDFPDAGLNQTELDEVIRLLGEAGSKE